MKVKIISDGFRNNTKVINAETGEIIEGITSIWWDIDCDSKIAHAKFEMIHVPVELIGELEAVKETP